MVSALSSHRWEACTGAMSPRLAHTWELWYHTKSDTPAAVPRGGLSGSASQCHPALSPSTGSSPTHSNVPSPSPHPGGRRHHLCPWLWASPLVGAIWGPAEQANILTNGSQKREKMAKPQFVKIRNLLKREKRLCKNPCWWNRVRIRAGANSGRGARKNCHLLAARDVPAIGLATYPTIITFSSHWAGEHHSPFTDRETEAQRLSHWPYGQPALAPGAVSPRLPTISQITCLLPFLVCQGPWPRPLASWAFPAISSS